MRVRTVWVLLGLLCFASSLCAQISTIGSLQSQADINAVPFGPLLGPAITTGSPNAANGGFFLDINGVNFNEGNFAYVQWTDPVAATVYQIVLDGTGPAYINNFSPTQIQVFIPFSFYSTPVASPDPVKIQVFQYVLIGQATVLQSSNIATYTLNPPLALPSSGAALPPGIVGSAYSQPFFSGGTPPYTAINLVSGALPPGLFVPAVPTNSQLLAGMPTTPGAYSFRLSVTDEWGNTITLGPPGAVPLPETLLIVAKLQIATTSLPSGQAGAGYSLTLTAVGGFPPYQWTASGLPASLTLNRLTGVLSGTAPAQGTYTFGFTVTDSTGATAVTSLQAIFTPPPPPPLTFATASSLPGGVVGTPYSTVIQASGGNPPYQFSVTGGSLPGGLTLNSGGGLTGTPTAYGQFSFTVQVTDSTGTSTSLGFVVNIRPAPLTITTGTSLTAPVGSPINIVFAASGGATPYSWSATGSFPAGAQFSGAGVLTAPAPATSATYSFTVSVADTQGNSTSKPFTLTVAIAPLVITTTSPLPGATVGKPYSVNLFATGGTTPYTWTATGVPAGLTLSTTGVLSGTPTAFGSFTLSVTVTDSSPPNPLAAGGPLSTTGSFALTVAPAALTITTTSLPAGVVGTVYSATFNATGGVTPYTWTFAGLPAGLSGGATGVITGTPTAVAAATVSGTVTDARGTTVTASLALAVTPAPLSIGTASLPNGTVGTAYSASLAASGGIPPYTFSASGLPAGVTLSGTTLSGTPTAAGSFQVSVTVKDSAGTSATASYPVTIALPSVSPVTVTVTGVSGTAPPASQPPLQIGIASSYPVPITVNLVLTFTPVSGADDPSVQFSTGGRTAQETIAAGSTLALPALAIQTGTVAGTITITAQLLAGSQNITPNPTPSLTLTVASLAPVISKVSAAATAGGFTISVVGYATSRSVTQALLQFTPAAGATVSSTSFTIPTTPLFTTWYGSTAAAPFGSQFTFTQPFTVSGSTASLTSVSVTLTNAQGNSNTVSAPVP